MHECLSSIILNMNFGLVNEEVILNANSSKSSIKASHQLVNYSIFAISLFLFFLEIRV
jgi:hypothetical protein